MAAALAARVRQARGAEAACGPELVVERLRLCPGRPQRDRKLPVGQAVPSAKVRLRARRDRAQRVLRRKGVLHFPDRDKLEREAERARDDCGDRDPAAGKPDDDCALVDLRPERVCQLRARIRTILEER